MAVRLSLEVLKALAPKAQPIYLEMFERFEELAPFGLLDTVLRLEHFMAQCLHETGGLRLLVENLNYSAERLRQVWPTRFPSEESTLGFARHPPALANKVYNGRMGNRVGSSDGWTYIGRGLLQITGRESYQRVGEALGIALVTFPNLAVQPEHGLAVAGEIWKAKRANALADLDNIERVTRAINGGQIGLSDRKHWLARLRSRALVEAR